MENVNKFKSFKVVKENQCFWKSQKNCDVLKLPEQKASLILRSFKVVKKNQCFWKSQKNCDVLKLPEQKASLILRSFGNAKIALLNQDD